MAVRITGFDHAVLRVSDVERSLAFYLGLGLAPVRIEQWRRGEVLFPSVRVNDDVIIDLLQAPADRAGVDHAGTDRAGTDHAAHNVDHLCFVVEPTDWHAVVADGRFEVVDGPATRYGAHGNGESLYVRDPDRNVIELRYYP